jgi:cellulose synthase/poly-beta-1,6-N-acetylglucosamine synthase-like glycosyltransferase
VCGTLQFRGTAESRQTEGVYWKYESMLRLMENRLGATLTASGAMYALRRQCYRPLQANVLVEDFVIPMNARKLGYRVLYDPEAIGTEFAADSVAGEFTRRVRIAVGSFRALGELLRTPLRPFAYLAFFSHKLLRWILPALLIGLLASSALLQSNPIYCALLATQCAFYLWALAGYVFHGRLQGVRFGLLAYYLVAIHLAYLVGFVRFVRGRDTATWQRVS